MSKQEELWGALSWILSEIYWKGKRGESINYREYGTEIFASLHSQGVVIQIERELPEPRYPNSEMDAYIWEGQQDMLKAGYTAVEPLIEVLHTPRDTSE